MNKKVQELIDQNKELSTIVHRLEQIASRKTAQIARGHVENSTTENFRDRYRQLKVNDFFETAISIFSWENITKNPRNFLNSKRIEKQISTFGSVCMFKHKAAGGQNIYVLPFTGEGGSLNCYNEFEFVKPYTPAGYVDLPDRLVVNENCVILSDFFQFSQTAANTSFSVKEAILVYAALIADTEIAKIINRNWLKFPIFFDIDESTPEKDAETFALAVKQIVEAIEGNETAVVTDLVKNLKILQTGAQYFGTELQETKRDYERELMSFLGISHTQQDKKERAVVSEIDKNADEYGINLTKRLQNRQMALDNAKEIFPEFFENCSIKVNLSDYNKNEGVNENASTADNDTDRG